MSDAVTFDPPFKSSQTLADAGHLSRQSVDTAAEVFYSTAQVGVGSIVTPFGLHLIPPDEGGECYRHRHIDAGQRQQVAHDLSHNRGLRGGLQAPEI
ncbi:MAG: hypothetical protein OXQ29_28370 [Rhodospirillaceae bacterium]|nr:hypothetical protein [Rhodospirillaceae bacterium]